MPEPTGDAGAQGAAAASAQGATPPAQGAAATTPATGGDDAQQGGTVTVESLQAKLAELERDNRKYRQERAAAEAKAKADAEASMPELELLRSQLGDAKTSNAELTARVQEQSLRASSVIGATRLGFRNPDIAYRLLDPRAIEYDDAGLPKNVDALLQALAKSDPYLLAQTDFGGGNRGGSAAPAAGQDMNAIIRGAAASKGR